MEAQQSNDGMSIDQFRYQALLQEHAAQTSILTEKIIALQVENQVLKQQLQKTSNAESNVSE